MPKPTSLAKRTPTIVAAVLLFTGAAFALPATGPETTQPTKRVLNSGEALQSARDALVKMELTLRRAVTLQEQAEKKTDVIRLNCINDKLRGIKGHLAVSNTSITDLNVAIGKNDDSGATYQHTRVQILLQKVLVLGTQAENCVGDDLSYTGNTTVNVEIDSSIPTRDATDTGYPDVRTDRPPSASQTL